MLFDIFLLCGWNLRLRLHGRKGHNNGSFNIVCSMSLGLSLMRTSKLSRSMRLKLRDEEGEVESKINAVEFTHGWLPVLGYSR
jgi:hypothetical protein